MDTAGVRSMLRGVLQHEGQGCMIGYPHVLIVESARYGESCLVCVLGWWYGTGPGHQTYGTMQDRGDTREQINMPTAA